MAITPNYPYDTVELIHVVSNLKTAQTFLLDKFFPNIVLSDTEFVAIDVDVGKRRMAPFVSPIVEGKLIEQRRYQTNSFKPAYTKDLRAPDLRKPVRRQIGEKIGGEMSGQERADANMEMELQDQIDILTRRMEWMATQSLLTGTVTVRGEGFPEVLVDFGRDPTLTVTLTGSAAWIQANIITSTGTPVPNGVSPSNMIEGWQRQILKKSGANVTDIIFTTSAWDAFKLDPLVKGAINTPEWNKSGNIIDPGARIVKGAIRMGMWGQFTLWVYNDWYVDENNVEKPMMPDGTLIMTGPELEGTRAFGQIIDAEFNYSAMAFAPKTWTEKNPGQRFLLMQSSPLIIPSRVNAGFSATVCPAVYT